MRKTFSVSYDPDNNPKIQEFLDYIKLNRLDRSEVIRALIEGKDLKFEPLVTRAEIEELQSQIAELQKNGVRVIERADLVKHEEEKQPETVDQSEKPTLAVNKELIRSRYFKNK